MKKILLMAAILAISVTLSAQKKPLDHSVYDSWEAVGTTTLSPKGNVLTYEVNPQEGDGKLTIRVMGKKGRVIEIERGYQAQVLDDESFAVCLIKPQYAKTRQARIDKKKGDDMPKDSLAVIDLRTGSVTRFPDVKGYKAGRHALKAFAFTTADTTFIPKKERKDKDMGSPLAVYHFADGSIDTLRHIQDYAFSKDGLQLALVRKCDKKTSETGFYSVAGRESHFLADTAAWHKLPAFNEDGTQALFTVADDTLKTGSKHPSLYLYRTADRKAVKLVDKDARQGLPEDWGMTQNTTYFFSHDGSRIFAGVQPFEAPEDTTLVSFELPGLDIWNWDAPTLPPHDKLSLQRDKERVYTALVNDGKLTLLEDSKFGRLASGDRWDAPVALLQEMVNPVESQWNEAAAVRISLVSLKDGSRRQVAEGALASARLSPDAKYILWWDSKGRGWTLYDIASGKARPLGREAGVNFWNEESDTPSLPYPYGAAGWTEGDADVLLCDFYDIWKVPVDGGKPVRLTAGREKGLTYRYISTKDRDEKPGIAPSETILMSIFDNATKENGLASVQVAAPEKSFKTLAKGGYTWSGVQKASKADVYTYLKGNFRDPMDVYYTAALGKGEQKFTAINPQINDYNWGTVELYHWNAYDGTPLDGLLYKPEDWTPEKKYPVMIYFYEKYSESLYTHYTVQPSWSIINIPFYVSRGYVVFVPDIVYAAGIPGESAYNCIVSGAESLTAFPWIDKDNMAIQGQSWGGYQVAYLITRTDMFKAAGAGAPVSNMTSAYGGIRWESGNSRQVQYEQGQSRIGQTLWEAPGLYLENSALFKLPNVTTPVLIMHNDADGAVPWYQGIEMFMGLRRLGKPAWLLEYNDEAHNLRQRRNRKDLTIRLQQFFDHYLKGDPEPAWMRTGVPTAKKNFYFGYENAE